MYLLAEAPGCQQSVLPLSVEVIPIRPVVYMVPRKLQRLL